MKPGGVGGSSNQLPIDCGIRIAFLDPFCNFSYFIQESQVFSLSLS